MSLKIYDGGFKNWHDVIEDFGIIEKGKNNLTSQEPEAVYATYSQQSYEGDAEVYFVKDGKVYFACGSHCSCYGLEGQWEPEHMPLSVLINMQSRKEDIYKDNILMKWINDVKKASLVTE